MGYEFAKKTIFLATKCLCCNRPLCDADSVEKGIGPICQERYGYGYPTATPDLLRAAVELRKVDESVRADLMDGVSDSIPEKYAHTLSNKITHRIACLFEAKDLDNIVRLVKVLHHLGYTVLAEKVSSRLEKNATVIVERTESGEVAITTPYNAAFVSELKSAISYSNRRWGGKDDKRWFVSLTEGDKLVGVINRHFAGEFGFGSKGLWVVGE